MPTRLRALIVEDSPAILESLKGLLEELELVKVVATAAAEAEACAWMDGISMSPDIGPLGKLHEILDQSIAGLVGH